MAEHHLPIPHLPVLAWVGVPCLMNEPNDELQP